MNDAFCTVQQDLNADAFVKDTSLRRLPYQPQNASPIWFRCYLLLGNDNKYGLYFHGPHAIMDGGPTLNAFALMLQWMTNDATEPAENLPWGTEWHNLPLGPVSATGGPREDWDNAGIELLKQLPDFEAVRTVCFYILILLTSF
jgi:hypothetical protein